MEFKEANAHDLIEREWEVLGNSSAAHIVYGQSALTGPHPVVPQRTAI